MTKEEKHLKKLICLFVLLAVCLSAAACSSQSSSSDGKVTLKFFHRWPKEPEKSYFEEAVKEFEAAHPDIHIQTEAVLNDSYKDKVKVMLGTTSPLIFSFHGATGLLINSSKEIKPSICRLTISRIKIGPHSLCSHKSNPLLMTENSTVFRGKWTLNHSFIIRTFFIHYI